jgi:hypothetical protein
MPLAPMGCAVQLHERSERRGSWSMNAIDGWYLRTSDEHYRCHVIFVKNTRSERISDTVHFKHRHITIPTVTPEDTIVKCLNDLTQALRERRNTKGAIEYDALQKLDELLNKIPVATFPVTTTTNEPTRTVTFSETTKPPAEDQSNSNSQVVIPAPRVRESTPVPRVHIEIAPPRVQNAPTTMAKATIDKPIPTNIRKEPTATQMNLRNKIKEARDTRSRLALRTHMALRPQIQRERIQLVRDEETGEYLKYRQLLRDPKHTKIWNTSSANEFGRLAQGVGGRVIPTNTIFFIPQHQVPMDRRKDVTYGSFVCDIKSNKAETHRTRLTAGGDRINYPGDVGTPTADMTLFKILLNSIISTKNAKCLMLDVKDFYLNTPMTRYEYMRIKLTDIPEEIIVEYKLREIATPDGFVYIEIRKGMYGLPQAGIIAQQLLEKRLAKVGYHQSKIVPGL